MNNIQDSVIPIFISEDNHIIYMGFGAYDEDDQQEQNVETNDEDAVKIERNDSENEEVEYNYGEKSTSELIDQMHTNEQTDETEET